MEKHKIWYDTNDDIVYLEFVDHYLESDTEWVRENLLKLVEGKPHRQLILPMTKTHKVENRATREKSSKILEEAKITHLAFYGESTAANRMIIKVLLKTGATKFSGDFFKTREEAVAWLKSKR